MLKRQPPRLTRPRPMRKIGVFDSGIGGLSVAKAVEHALPDDEVIWLSDREHLPYGDKTAAQLLGFMLPILQEMVKRGCDVIVIACNTATTLLINELRQCINVPLVGIEPMVKPAAEQTKTGIIAVCATPATLASARYAWLKHMYAPNVRVLEPDCAGWARMVEQSKVNEQLIAQQIDDACAHGADVIVLGCTHYHWIERSIVRIAAGRAKILQPEAAVVRQVKRVLATLP